MIACLPNSREPTFITKILKLTDLQKLVSSIKFCFPNLEFLSLIGNPLCPTPIVGAPIAAQPNEMQIDQFSTDSAQNKHNQQVDEAGSSSLLAFAYQKYRCVRLNRAEH